jgi:hypothetical protein
MTSQIFASVHIWSAICAKFCDFMLSFYMRKINKTNRILILTKHWKKTVGLVAARMSHLTLCRLYAVADMRCHSVCHRDHDKDLWLRQRSQYHDPGLPMLPNRHSGGHHRMDSGNLLHRVCYIECQVREEHPSSTTSSLHDILPSRHPIFTASHVTIQQHGDFTSLKPWRSEEGLERVVPVLELPSRQP